MVVVLQGSVQSETPGSASRWSTEVEVQTGEEGRSSVIQESPRIERKENDDQVRDQDSFTLLRGESRGYLGDYRLSTTTHGSSS